MNSLKALFSSAIALIAILMLTLFTSCAEPQIEQAPQLPVQEATYKNDLDASLTDALAELEAESLATAAGSLAVAATKNVSAEGISVMRSATCTGIESHEPVGAASSFSLDVGRVYLYTKVEMPKGQTGTIQHVWKLNGKPISIVDLDVKGPNFRTRSYKTITEKMAGSWTVDVVTLSGDIIETVAFDIEE